MIVTWLLYAPAAPWSSVHDEWFTRNLAWAMWRWQARCGR